MKPGPSDATGPSDASPSAERPPFYSLTVEQVLSALSTSRDGLAADEAARRLSEHGPNVIVEKRGEPLWRKFVANLTNFFALLLWAAAGLAFLIRAMDSAVAIVAVILVNAVFGFWQEYRAEQATKALKRLMPPYARVRRDGRESRILAAQLVPGDIVVLEEGDAISADGRILAESDLRTNNSTLTGESEPVRKTADAVLGEKGLTWTQMPNLIFAGTSVAAGTAEAVVFATGMETELGHIATLTESVEAEMSPLQRQIRRIAITVAELSVAMGVGFFLLGVGVAHLGWHDGIIFAIGIVLANVPEGLLPTVSLSLATGVQRLVKRNALVKKLSSVETLGSATVICTDKTGTLTQNQMTVREAWTRGTTYAFTGVGYSPEGEVVAQGDGASPPPEPATAPQPEQATTPRPELRQLLLTAALCNNARLVPPGDSRRDWSLLGDPTEGALLVAARKGGVSIEEELAARPRVQQLPFDSRRKRMSVVHPATPRRGPRPASLPPTEALTVYTKGAPNEVLSCCTRIQDGGTERALTDADRADVVAANDRYAEEGLRVLAVATRALERRPPIYTVEAVERDLTFIGLMAMQDPPRPEVTDAVSRAHTAGIRVIMITGDYGLTAEAIARKIGIITGAHPALITGAELDGTDDATLKGMLSREREVLFARVAPEHKLRVVAALRDLGETVAVTGDGVNDAPALKRADIGVAMGRAGTDVAKEAAAMILTDDNFASIVAAIEEGRAVFDNIRKFITYIFAHLAAEAVPYLMFALTKVPLPLTAIQILAIDLGTETLPALALGTEKPEPDVMQRPPRPRNEKLLNRATLLRGYFFLGLLSTVGVLVGYFWQLFRTGWHWGIPATDPLYAPGSLYQREVATMVFLGIIIMQVANVFACRTERVSVFRVGFLGNRLVLVGIAFEIAFAILTIYTPPLQDIFGTAPVGWEAWLLLIAFTPLVFFGEEGRKALMRRRSSS